MYLEYIYRGIRNMLHTDIDCQMLYRQVRLVVLLVHVLGGLVPTEAFPFGAPKKGCVSLQPGHHGTTPAPGTSPYQLHLGGALSYSPGETIKVMINGRDFKGFILQARRADELSPLPVGVFGEPPPYSKYLDCHHSNDTITHANPSPKWNMQFSWIAPEQSASDVIFVATIALEKSTYWMNITSDALVAKYPTEPPYVTSASTSTRSTTGCGFHLIVLAGGYLVILEGLL